MYLEHFGLNEPPFRITPVTEFFFSGANRGEILDALIYSITEVEGIVKVTGEVGSGKTMLCRMLLEKLPANIETIYLANPSLSREEMLYAIADGLGLNIDGERVGIIMQNIQNRLEEKAHEGKRVVVLVDEAHAMPPDTLEELRLLYNLQVGNAKLLQLILFGQPELNAKLDQPNMRQLKDRIVHHFNMQPLSRANLESYLMFRMRAANYHGPNVFSQKAVKLIAAASHGLMRRVNVLADKSLLAAFIENTHNIEVRHVEAAMRDSELKPVSLLHGKELLVGVVIAALVVAALAIWWALEKSHGPTGSAASPLAASGETGQAISTRAGQALDGSSSPPSNPPAIIGDAPAPAVAQPVAMQAPVSHTPVATTGATGEKTAISPRTHAKTASLPRSWPGPDGEAPVKPGRTGPKHALEPQRADGADRASAGSGLTSQPLATASKPSEGLSHSSVPSAATNTISPAVASRSNRDQPPAVPR